MINYKTLIILSTLFLNLLFVPPSAKLSAKGFEDTDGCLVCHKYPKMGRITEDGVRRSYYVMPHIFENTVHRNVACRDCHNYIKELPHEPVTTGVSCDSECHSVKNPATGQNFSHKSIADLFMKSVHGREKSVDESELDKPYCVTCHTNPVYNPDEFEVPEEITDRCEVCHEDRNFVNSWYKHTSRRIREVKRQPEEIVALCSSCHGDKDFIKRRQEVAEKEQRKLGDKFAIAVETYDASFHGKVTRYGFEQAANCVDCHIDQDNYYLSIHNILPSRDPESPVSKDNRVNTCKQCHTYAGDNYAAIDPHPSSKLEHSEFRHNAEKIYGIVGNTVLLLLISLALFETFRRRRDGVNWRLKNGSSWRRSSKSKRDRIE